MTPVANETAPPAKDIAKAAIDLGLSLVNLVAGIAWGVLLAVFALNALASLFDAPFIASEAFAHWALPCLAYLLLRDWLTLQKPPEATLPAAPTLRAVIKQEVEAALTKERKDLPQRIRASLALLQERGKV